MVGEEALLLLFVGKCGEFKVVLELDVTSVRLWNPAAAAVPVSSLSSVVLCSSKPSSAAT